MKCLGFILYPVKRWTLPEISVVMLHKVFGWTLFVQAWIHTVAHIFNLIFNVTPVYNDDADPVYWARRNFKLAGYRLLPAYKPPEGSMTTLVADKVERYQNLTFKN